MAWYWGETTGWPSQTRGQLEALQFIAVTLKAATLEPQESLA